jgi:protein-disulfide isomerase
MGNKKANQNKNIKKQLRQEKAKRKNKVQQLMTWTIGVVLLAVVVLLFVNSLSTPKTGATVDAQEFQYEKQPSMGATDAPVKLVEFADFKCPACKQFDQTILPQLKKDFVDTGVVQMYFINYPIISPNADSRTAAIAGEAVYNQNPAEFWKFYEAVYAHQGDERNNWATPDALVQIAKQANLNLDFDNLKKDIEDQRFGQAVKDDEAIVGKLGVNSTPTIYLNGQPVSENDTFNYSAIKALIEKSKGQSGK